jgi:hypothetical protein
MPRKRPSSRVKIASERLKILCSLRGWGAQELSTGTGISLRTIQICLKKTDHYLNTRTYAQLLAFLDVKDPRQFDMAAKAHWLGLHVLFPDLSATKVCAGHLPRPADPDLFVGRDEPGGPMDQLRKAWADGTAIVQVVASGGIGKSTLAFHFLEELSVAGYPGCRSVIDWSFYSQGQHDYQTDSQMFFRSALDHFALFDPSLNGWRNQSPDQIGRALARVYCQTTVGGLMILDGVEPLQNPAWVSHGRLKDVGLRTFLSSVMTSPRHPNRKRLILITTRWANGDLTPSANGGVRLLDLKTLTPQQGAKMLRGIRLRDDPTCCALRPRPHHDGPDEEQRAFESASRAYGGHPLALVLLGTFLLAFRDGYIDDMSHIESLADEDESGDDARHARRILRDYSYLLKRAESPSGRACLQLLYLLGLWDRPASTQMIEKIIATPIKGITDELANNMLALAKYELLRLRFLGDLNNPREIDIHPIIREFFAKLLRDEHPEVWARLHTLIFRAIVDDPGIDRRPGTPAEMEPLFHAVVHGCKAGLHEEALTEVLIPRLLRGSENYAASVGAVDSLIAALSHFFKPNDWGLPVRRGSTPQSGLTPEGEMKVLALAGLYLSSTTGYASRETRQVYCGDRVEQLVAEGPAIYARIHFLYGRWRVDLGRGVMADTLASATQLRDAIKAPVANEPLSSADFFLQDESGDLGVAHRAMAVTLMWLGRFHEAEAEARAGTSYPISSREQLHWLFTEPSIICRGVLAINLLHLGRQEEAVKEAAACVGHARAVNHPHTLAVALYMRALVEFFRDERGRVLEIAAELVDLTAQHHFPFWRGSGLVFHGWARGQGEKPGQALEQVETGIDLWRSTGARINDPLWVGIKAALASQTSGEQARELYGSAVRDAKCRSEAWCLPFLLLALARLERAGGIRSWRNWLDEAYRLAQQQGSLLIINQIRADDSFSSVDPPG